MPLYLYKIQPIRPQMLAVGPTPAEEHAVALLGAIQDHME
jgi:hypothetical protein